MPVERIGFVLKPDGFFDRNPALDVPPQHLVNPGSHCDAANASTLRTTMALSYLGTCGVSLPLGRRGRDLWP
jgi:hypothetical protein